MASMARGRASGKFGAPLAGNPRRSVHRRDSSPPATSWCACWSDHQERAALTHHVLAEAGGGGAPHVTGQDRVPGGRLLRQAWVQCRPAAGLDSEVPRTASPPKGTPSIRDPASLPAKDDRHLIDASSQVRSEDWIRR